MGAIPFEYLAFAVEAARFTAVTPPTHYANLEGLVNPKKAKYRPKESRGTLAANYRSKAIKYWAEWAGNGGLDNYILPFLLNMGVKGTPASSTPDTGVHLRTWTPTMNADDLKTGTVYFGDPNLPTVFQGAGATCDEIVIEADGKGDDGVTMSAKGWSNRLAKVSPPSMPAQLVSPLFTPQDMQLWMDTGTIGTTPITGRFLSCSITIPAGISYKFIPEGPSGNKTYNRLGRTKRAATVKFEFELLDFTQYDLYEADTVMKSRIRFNSNIITGAHRHYVEVDAYGTLDEPEWGEHAESNRTISFTTETEVDSTLGADFSVSVQSDRATV